jgi:hypothetical protein
MNELNPDEMERQIQLLIDRELSDEQQVELLRRIDENAPGAWRTVALRYVETDVLRSLFEEEERWSHPPGVIPLSSTDSPDLPVSTRERSASLFRTVWIAAAAIVFGVFMEVGIRVPESTSSETQPAIAVNEEERPTAIPPSFRAIESLDLALKDRGFEPVVSKAIYRAELPDGRRLLLPVQRLSFQPE